MDSRALVSEITSARALTDAGDLLRTDVDDLALLLAPSDLNTSACSNVPGSVANGHGFSLLNKPLVLTGGVCPNVTSLGRFILTSPDDPAGETALGRASICTELSGVVDDSSGQFLRGGSATAVRHEQTQPLHWNQQPIMLLSTIGY